MTEYIFTANYQPIKEQPIVILFDELHKELYDKGWTVHWEFNSDIDPALLKYNHCTTYTECRTVDANVATDVDAGAWNYRLDNLEVGGVSNIDMETGALTIDGLFTIDSSGETPNTSLVSFNVDLPKLTDGTCMFRGCTNLKSFTSDLSNLNGCQLMFANCPNLTSFSSDLSSLTTGTLMFGGNYETVERFICDVILGVDISEIPPEEMLIIDLLMATFLPMFSPPTSLDVASVQNIANTINDISNITPPANLDPKSAAMWGQLDIGIDPTLEGNSDIEAALTTIRNKGWDVTPMDGVKPFIIPGEGLLKYNNCRTAEHCRIIDADVAIDVDENGAWNYRLDNLESGCGAVPLVYNGLFYFNEDNPNISLKSFNVDLPNLTDGHGMFMNCPNLTSFSSDLPKLTDGSGMFYECSNLTSWNINLPNLTKGGQMFKDCPNLTSFEGDLPKLTHGGYMFQGCSNLTSWTVDLPELTVGYMMFWECTNLASWNIDLPKLTDGECMFMDCTGLTSFSGDLPNLTNGECMFNRCTNLTSFSGYLSSLTCGYNMFYGCSNLTSFEGDLSSLENGSQMFRECKLNLASVQNIANTINDLTDKTSDGTEEWGQIHIGMPAALWGNADVETALAAIRAKGWTVSQKYT